MTETKLHDPRTAAAGRGQGLEDLRREIDRIDDQMQDLLVRRARLVDQVGGLKSGSAAPARVIRVGREAQILRRLRDRHTGPLPLSSVMGLWRQILGTFACQQAPLTVVIARDDQGAQGPDFPLWDLARDHYGSAVVAKAADTSAQAVRTVIDAKASVAVVPWLSEDDPSPWWRILLSEDTRTPRIIARVPAVSHGPGSARPTGLAVSLAPFEPSGADHSFLAIETTEPVSRSTLVRRLTEQSLAPLSYWANGRDGDHADMHLLEVPDHLAAGDPRLAALHAGFGETVRRLIPVGGYALPVDLR